MIAYKTPLDRFFRHRVLQHLLFWLAVLAYLTISYGRAGRYGLELLRSLCFLPAHLFLVYSFFYWLIPRFLLPRRFVLFSLLSVAAYACSVFLTYALNESLLAAAGLKNDWTLDQAILSLVTLLGAAVSIKLLKYWYRQKEQIMEVQQQKTEAELELLKAQVHPHFLFNTLNNLYSHTLHRSPLAPEIVLKLSALLRFMIYESRASEIPLKREMQILKDYIALEQLRYGNRLDISLSVTGPMEGKVIAPLLLLPLIENSFKHGTSKQLDQCWISLDVHVADEYLYVKLINSKEREKVPPKTSFQGMGLQNVRQRLQLLYGEAHQFSAREEGEMFIVQLQLKLKTASVPPGPEHFIQNERLYEMEMPAR